MSAMPLSSRGASRDDSASEDLEQQLTGPPPGWDPRVGGSETESGRRSSTPAQRTNQASGVGSSG